MQVMQHTVVGVGELCVVCACHWRKHYQGPDPEWHLVVWWVHIAYACIPSL